MKYIYVLDEEEKYNELQQFIDDLRSLDVPSDYEGMVKDLIGQAETDLSDLAPYLISAQNAEMQERQHEYRKMVL